MEQKGTETMTHAQQAQPGDPPKYQPGAYTNSDQPPSYPIPTGQAAYPSHVTPGEAYPNPAGQAGAYPSPGYPNPGTHGPTQGYVIPGTQSQPYTDYSVNADDQMLVPGQERPGFGAMMGLSCFNAWCCCLILGIVGFIFARDGEKLFQQGLITEAREKYRVAKVVNIVGILMGIAVLIVAVIVVTLQEQHNY